MLKPTRDRIEPLSKTDNSDSPDSPDVDDISTEVKTGVRRNPILSGLGSKTGLNFSNRPQTDRSSSKTITHGFSRVDATRRYAEPVVTDPSKMPPSSFLQEISEIENFSKNHKTFILELIDHLPEELFIHISPERSASLNSLYSLCSEIAQKIDIDSIKLSEDTINALKNYTVLLSEIKKLESAEQTPIIESELENKISDLKTYKILIYGFENKPHTSEQKKARFMNSLSQFKTRQAKINNIISKMVNMQGKNLILPSRKESEQLRNLIESLLDFVHHYVQIYNLLSLEVR